MRVELHQVGIGGYVDCLRENRQPLTDVRDVIATMRLVDQLESPFWLGAAPARRD